MPIFAAINSFNAGELSPKMLGRTDVSQYAKGCIELKNFLVTPYGAVERRPGTQFLGEAKAGTAHVRLIRFVFSSTVAYVCEFGNYYIRFWSGDQMVQEIESIYPDTALDQLQFVQSADVMTIVHGAYPVQELKRLKVNEFTLTPKQFKFPPMLDPNLDDAHTIKPSGLTGNITLTATKPTFEAGNVGGFFQLIHTRKENEIAKDFKGNGVSDALEVFGYWSFTSHGTWTGNLTIQRSYDHGATWKDYRTYSSSKDSNTSTSGEEEEHDVLYRLQMTDYEQSGTGTLQMCRCLLVNPDFVTTGVVKITAVTDNQNASATVIEKLGGTDATAEWNEGAWSARRGYPRTVAFYEERQMYGGTSYRPQTVWGSRTNAWDKFLLGDKDDDGLDFTLASDTINTICWMCQHDALVIGTQDSEWTLSATSGETALTPSNFKVRRQSVYGSAGIAASMVGDVILFVQRGGRKVREFVFQWEKDGYTSPDMTILADHITASGVKEAVLQQLPDSILWCVKNDGTIAALTYERDQEVVGWQHHITAGKFRSVCVIPDGERDQIYFAIERQGKILIELMKPREWPDIRQAWYLDSAVQVRGDGITQIGNLSHLEGQTVAILADGAERTPRKVVSGRITLKTPADVVTVGLPYTSILSPMPIELETPNGQSLLRNKSIGELRIRFYDSVGGETRCNQGDWQPIISRDVLIDRMDSAILPKNMIAEVPLVSGYAKSIRIDIQQSAPLPLNVNSLVATYTVNEN